MWDPCGGPRFGRMTRKLILLTVAVAVAKRCATKRSTIIGTAGHDRVEGLRGNDLFCGGRGRDRLVGGPGRDRLLGGRGRDICLGGPGRDRVRCP